MKKQHFIYTIILYVIAVFYLASTTPITPHEANIFYNLPNIVSALMHLGDELVKGVLGLRIFFIFFGFLSLILFYKLSQRYFTRQSDVYLATLIFMVLPGILTAITLANISIIVLTLVLLFVLLYESGYRVILIFLMLILFFIHETSVILFVALLLYGLIHKDKQLAIVAAAFLAAFIYLSKGIIISGRPSGHFVEIFGLYATVFSPLLFIYFFYAMYRVLLREKKTLIWYISFTAFAFSLLLSLRQRVSIADFAPYVMISVVIMLYTINSSVRVRLPEFQKRYRQGFYVVMFFLFVNLSLIILHKQLFYFFKDSSSHFAYRIYKPYHLALELKAEGIDCYDGTHGRERFQLRYYNITPCAN